ncbi:adrenodoxin-like [Lampris incognitus]|uniref:adrenodoxin-like n=1 Tax=Lampris incognitus TaxID=2546036 RepID=UPI0024B4DF91|nr:adrenodoxin-like [Lampris incognitus]
MWTVSVARRLLRFNPRLSNGRAATAAPGDFTCNMVGSKVLFSSCARPLRSEERVMVHFISCNGEKITTSGATGDSLLDVVVNQKLDIPGFGACEGTLACSTCHVILEQGVYDQLGHIVDEELDMLDLAYGLTDTSRLGCQVCLSKSLDGLTLQVPEGVNDMRHADDTGSTSSP